MALYGRKVDKKVILFFFALGFLRLAMPFELRAVNYPVHDWYLYPFFKELCERDLGGGITVIDVLLTVWLMGSLAFALRFLYQLYMVKRVISRSTGIAPSSHRIYEAWGKAAKRAGYSGKSYVAVTDEFSTAVSVGIFHPVILFPGDMLDFPEEETEGILEHEIRHFLKGDVVKKWLLNLVKCFFWWNPAVYLFAKGAEQMMELERDREVCSERDENGKILYLQGILHVVKKDFQKETRCGVGYAGSRSEGFLQRRFREILTPWPKWRAQTALSVIIAGLTVFIASYLFIIQPARMPGGEELQGAEAFTPVPEEEITDFLLALPDGTYIYVEDMLERDVLTEEEIRKEPYCDLYIYGMEE